MVDPYRPNVVDGPLSWLNTRPVILGQGFFDHISQPIARVVKKPSPKLTTPDFNGFAKAKRQSVFNRNLGGDVGSRHVYENGSGPKRN